MIPSTQVTIHYFEPFLVEINSDLEMFFLDHDIAYDQGGMEFGYPETYAIKLLNLWEEKPIQTLMAYSIQRENIEIIAGLALDFAEHLFERYYSNIKDRNILSNLLIIGRNSLDKVSSELTEAIEIASSSEAAAFRQWADYKSPEEADYAANATKDALKSVSYIKKSPDLVRYHAKLVMRDSQISMGFQFEHSLKYPEREEGTIEQKMNRALQRFYLYKEQEAHWQVRRYIDVVNAWQDDLPWPDLSATKTDWFPVLQKP